MKRPIFLSIVSFFAIILPLTLQSQIADISWEDPTPFSKQSYYSQVVEETDDAFYVLKTSVVNVAENEIKLEKYSKNDFSYEGGFTIYTPTMYSKTEDKRLLDYDKIIKVQDGFLVFFTEFILEKKTFTSYCQKFSLDGDEVGTLKQLEVFTGDDKTVIGKYAFTPSPFGDGFILTYSRPFILYSNEFFRFKFFDFKLEEKWTKEFVFPFHGKEFEVQQIKASVDSTVYIMIKVLDDNEKEREKKGNRNVTYSYNLLSFHMNPEDTSKQFKNFPLKLGKKFITDISYEVNDHKEIICAGYFADKKDMAISGAFYLLLESVSGQVRKNNLFDFQKTFLTQFVDTKNPDRGVGMRDFKLNDLDILSDGTIYLIGEQYYEKIMCSGQPPNLQCITESYYNDIVVTRISNEGKVEWTSNIPKRSFDREGGFLLSYSYRFMDNGRVVFIYNDSPKNLETTNPLELKYVSKSGVVSVIAEINKDGKLHREPLHENKKTKIVLRPKTHLHVKDELVIYGLQGNKQYWGKIRVY